ncbi:cerebellin-1-like [Mya arenaria]|uniref:cerebellin-1-like n=1 Tax=Mya arenaria TaxID=6604 RepID=UPI0022E16FB4|nr:cerebellin-1-like [Mya arenaria]
MNVIITALAICTVCAFPGVHCTSMGLEERLEFMEQQVKILQEKDIVQGESMAKLHETVNDQSSKIARLEQNDIQQRRKIAYLETTLTNNLKQKRFVMDGTEGPVAFTALKMNTQSNMANGKTIIFEKAVLNVGNAYDPPTSVFTSPQTGIYLFSSTLVNRPQNISLHAQIVTDGQKVAMIHCSDETTYDQGSQTVVIQVNAGQRVWIKTVDYQNEIVHGDAYSTFAGYLLWPL